MSNEFRGTGNVGIAPNLKTVMVGKEERQVADLRVFFDDYRQDGKGGVGLGAGVGGGGRNVGVGVGGNLGTVGARKFYTAKLEVLFGKGAKPDETGEIYDARSVIETIRARLAPAGAIS